MKSPPTDFKILQDIYERYYPTFCSFKREEPNRAAKIFVPIHIVPLAKEFGVDPDIIFGRLYYHLEPKYGFAAKDGSRVAFFVLKAGEDVHCINFPLMTSVLAGLWEERRKHWTSRVLSIAAIVISIIALMLKSRTPAP